MKKTAFLLALLLAAVFILPADAATYEADGLFRLRYDETAYTLDDQTYAYESETGASRWFFVLYNDEMTFDMSLLRMENDAGLTLSTAAEDRKQTYLDELLDWYQDEDASLLETVEAGDNEFGPYLMAETVIDGNAIDLQAYYNDSSLAADERLQEALRELLAGFEQDGETPVLEK